MQISQRDERACRRRTQGLSEQTRPIASTSFVCPSSVDHQAMVATTSSVASTIISIRENQPIDNMANPVSTVRHNVFQGLGVLRY